MQNSNRNTALDRNPQFTARTFVVDRVRWGVKAFGAGHAGAVIMDAPTSFGLEFLSEDGAQRTAHRAEYRSLDTFDDSDLIEIWYTAGNNPGTARNSEEHREA